MYNPDTLTETIKSEARRLGFFACGMAKAQSVSADMQHDLQQWLQRRGHADMAYMANNTDLRLDPRLLMPGAESIVCVTMNYTPPQRMREKQYHIAAYAYGKDYHDIVRQRLYQLLAYIKTQECDVEGRVCCDTTPILERYWAQQAGLGWTGRHRQLIIPPHPTDTQTQTPGGTMFFLGELLLNIPLQYDAPMPNRCGTCRRCIDACPTQALSHDVFLAEHCLSYQLIENREALSEEARQHIGRTIYGCDRCQQACPWNRFAQPTDINELQPSSALLSMTDEEWEQLDEETYRRLFKGSAVKRAKYAGLKRNINAAREWKEKE